MEKSSQQVKLAGSKIKEVSMPFSIEIKAIEFMVPKDLGIGKPDVKFTITRGHHVYKSNEYFGKRTSGTSSGQNVFRVVIPTATREIY